MINSLPPVCSHAIRTILMVWVRITLGFQPRVIRTQTINIFSYCMNKQGITYSMTMISHWCCCKYSAFRVQINSCLFIFIYLFIIFHHWYTIIRGKYKYCTSRTFCKNTITQWKQWDKQVLLYLKGHLTHFSFVLFFWGWTCSALLTWYLPKRDIFSFHNLMSFFC